jgi:amino acid adenylation domain-containing protein
MLQINLVEYLISTTERFPRKPALIDGGGAVDFESFELSAFCLSRKIHDRVGSTNCPIAVIVEKSARTVIGFMAALMSGNFYCPIDPALPVERIRDILEDLQPGVIVASVKTLPLLKRAGVGSTRIEIVDCVEPTDASHGLRAALIREMTASRIDTDPCYVIFTSGSTGKPKGVTIAHRSVIDYIEWARATFSLTDTLVLGNQAPFHFDNSVLDIYLCLSLGATLDIIPEHLFGFPVRLLEHVEHHGINFVFWVPSVLARAANVDALAYRKPKALTNILFAGEIMPARQLRYWLRHYPGARFANLYGPTEITVDCTYFPVPPDFDEDSVPIGIPCRNSDVLILNEASQPAAPGETGELCVRGASLALGYWNAPDKTDAVFVQNPLHEHYRDPIYRTGDLVTIKSDGNIYFLGRKDTQIKHQGYRIELGEIELAAARVDGVLECVAGYDAERQEIYAVVKCGKDFDQKSFQRQLAQSLPRYTVPTRIVTNDEFPMTPNGKIDRKALASEVTASAPGS